MGISWKQACTSETRQKWGGEMTSEAVTRWWGAGGDGDVSLSCA